MYKILNTSDACSSWVKNSKTAKKRLRIVTNVPAKKINASGDKLMMGVPHLKGTIKNYIYWTVDSKQI